MRWVRAIRVVLLTVGGSAVFLAAWLLLGGPILVDRLLVENDAPGSAVAIVCIGGGLTSNSLPTDEGWRRIHTAVQLHIDNYAPVVVFSGGGSGQVSEADVYAEGAAWLGLPDSAAILDPIPSGTNEHPHSLLKVHGLRLTRDAPLLIVTSPLHARRVALCFRKAGYTHFRVVTSFVAVHPDPRIRDRRKPVQPGFQPSGKRYDDPINRLRWGLDTLLTSLREAVAIGAYALQGYV